MVLASSVKKVSRASDVAEIIEAVLATYDEIDRQKEHFFVVGLNGANAVIMVDLVTVGIVNQCPVHPREVFRRAIIQGCSAVIVSHNHPGGQLDPSAEDCDVTQRLKVAGEVIGIGVLDHVIVTDGGYYSFAQEGLL